MVFKFLASLLFGKILFKVLLASMKTITNGGIFTESRIRIPHPIPSNTSPAYGTIYRITGGFLYAATTSNVKRVTGRIFKISKCFHRGK
jgi:hypothetical protein